MEFKPNKSKITLPVVLNAVIKDKFKDQFKALLESSKDFCRIVYVFNSERPIPRLKGESTVIYIGKANGSLYQRYSSLIRIETDTYWDRYKYIMEHYGIMSVDIYKTDDPKITENNFLHDYHIEYMEAPPLNNQSYKVSLLNDK